MIWTDPNILIGCSSCNSGSKWPFCQNSAAILLSPSVNFRWFFCWPIALTEETDKSSISKIGLEKSVPKGLKRFISRIFLIVISFSVNNTSTGFTGSNEVVLDNSFIHLFKPSANDSIFSISIVIPAAIWWPPNLAINSWCADSISNIDTWSIDLAEPFAWFCSLSIFKINVGKANVSTIFEATIPKTPSCQFSFAKSKNKSPFLTFVSAIAIASSVIVATISFLSRLKCSTCSAKNAASSSSSVINNSQANDASSKRPTALSLGPIIKPIVSSSILSLYPASFSNALTEVGHWSFKTFNPCFTNDRFSSVKDTKSAMVPIATNALK